MINCMNLIVVCPSAAKGSTPWFRKLPAARCLLSKVISCAVSMGKLVPNGWTHRVWIRQLARRNSSACWSHSGRHRGCPIFRRMTGIVPVVSATNSLLGVRAVFGRHSRRNFGNSTMPPARPAPAKFSGASTTPWHTRSRSRIPAISSGSFERRSSRTSRCRPGPRCSVPISRSGNCTRSPRWRKSKIWIQEPSAACWSQRGSCLLMPLRILLSRSRRAGRWRSA